MVGISSNYNFGRNISATTLSIADSETSTDTTSNTDLTARTVTGNATGSFVLPVLDNLNISVGRLTKLTNGLSASELCDKACEAVKNNDFSYESNYIAAAYIGFHTGAIEPTDKQKAQDVRAGIVQAVTDYDKAAKELEEINKAIQLLYDASHPRDLGNGMVQVTWISPEMRKKINDLIGDYPDIETAKKAAEDKLKEAQDKIDKAQVEYKNLYGENANLFVVRNAINKTQFMRKLRK